MGLQTNVGVNGVCSGEVKRRTLLYMHTFKTDRLQISREIPADEEGKV